MDPNGNPFNNARWMHYLAQIQNPQQAQRQPLQQNNTIPTNNNNNIPHNYLSPLPVQYHTNLAPQYHNTPFYPLPVSALRFPQPQPQTHDFIPFTPRSDSTESHNIQPFRSASPINPPTPATLTSESFLPKSFEKRKRIRTTTVTQACNNCRNKHLKCDGAFPICTRCQTKGVADCSYKATRLKRGPAPRKSIDATTPSQKDVSAKPHVKASPFIEMMENKKLSDAGQKTLSTAAKEYATMFADFIMPIVGTEMPADDLLSYLSFDDLQPSFCVRSEKTDTIFNQMTSVKWLCILACGALCTGKSQHGAQFVEAARDLFIEICEKSSLICAENHVLLCFLCIMLYKDWERAEYHNTLACQMVKTHHYHVLEPSVLLVSSLFMVNRHEQESICVRAKSLCSQISESSSNLQKQHIAIAKILITVRLAWDVLYVPGCSVIDDYMAELHQLESSIPSLHSTLSRDFICLINATVSVLLQRKGSHAAAKKCADDVFGSLEDIAYAYSPLVMLSLMLLGQVHARENTNEKVQQCILILKHLSKYYPLAEHMLFQVSSTPTTPSESSDSEPQLLKNNNNDTPSLYSNTANPTIESNLIKDEGLNQRFSSVLTSTTTTTTRTTSSTLSALLQVIPTEEWQKPLHDSKQ